MNPLFHTQDELLKKLRLSGICKEHGDAMKIVDGCFARSRAEIRRAFGSTRVAAVVAVATSDDPQTDAEYEKVEFRALEEAMVERCLCFKLKSGYIDASADTGERYNTESLFRDWDITDLELRCQSLEKVVDKYLSDLGTLDSYARPGSFDSCVLGPDEAPPQVSGLDPYCRDVRELEE